MANKRMHAKVIKGEAATGLIAKALDTSVRNSQIEGEHELGSEIMEPPYPLADLDNMVEMSTVLQQCVEAYRRNIVGFGAVPEYINDEVAAKNEDKEMVGEWLKVQEYLSYFNFDMSFEDVFGTVIEDREKTGNGYIEILRSGTNLPEGGERVDPVTMKLTHLGEAIQVDYLRDGKKFKRYKKFRRYIQEIRGNKIFFKEFGDPRKLDKITGKFEEENEGVLITPEREATEILHLKIGEKPYGIPRWIGQLIHMYGSRKAEELNYRYFTQGRHTPAAILLHNATLSVESEDALTEYAKSVEGSDNAHKFLIIEAEGLGEGILEEEKKNAKVEIKSMADMLQQDALFLEYDESSRKKVQSSFRLPDIYVGRSADFNRATADTARAITEEQVFEPERNSLEFIINRKLLTDFMLKEVKVVLSKPEISNVEELTKVLDVAIKGKALTPNDIRDIVGPYLGKELEPFEGEEYDLPGEDKPEEPVVEGDPEATGQGSNPKEDPNNKGGKTNLTKTYFEDVTNVLKDVRDVVEELRDNE